MACELCGDLNGGRKLPGLRQSVGPPPPLRRNHKPKLEWRIFVEAAERCYICAVLLSGCRGVFKQHCIDETRISSVGLHFDYQQYIEEEADCEKLVRLRLADGSSFDIELFTLEDEAEYPLPAAWESVPRSDHKVSPSTDSEEAFELIGQWIEECTTDRKDHDSCPDATPVELPKRLVDVGADGELTVRLVEFSGSQTGRYVCLSHCWGRAQIVTTTTSTIQARMEGIAESQLSRTFRDAVAATRRLGVRYIWIDSICIIQDSALDWQVESAKMAAIYGNAWLTLVAVHSRDGNGGLFARTPDFEVCGRSPAGEAYRAYFRRRIDHHLEMQAGVGGEAAAAGHPTAAFHPLLTRAWVFQERLLSPRVLFFGPSELSWQCASVSECECGGVGRAAVPEVDVNLLYHGALTLRPGRRREPARRAFVARVWRTVVCSYSCLLLTKATDRLPAIGGAARDMRRLARGSSRYVAGMWEDSLADDLLWRAMKPRARPERKGDAPSWSWACVQGFVLYFDEFLFWHDDLWQDARQPFEHFSRVEGFNVVPLGVDEYGGLATGVGGTTIAITGLWASGALGWGERVCDHARPRVSHPNEPKGVYHVAFPNGAYHEVIVDYALDQEGPWHVSLGTRLISLRMSLMQEGSKEYLVSLILREVGTTEGSPLLYERIGCTNLERAHGEVDRLGGIYTESESRTFVLV